MFRGNPIGRTLRARVCPPRPLSTRPGEDDLILKYRLAMSHPTYTALALDDPSAMRDMRTEYLNGLEPYGDFRLPECWWNAGHLEQQLYRRLVKDAHARWAPKPRYEDVPGISTGNGAWPRPEQPPTGQGGYDDVYGVTVSPSFEYLIGGDGKRVPIWEDERFVRPPPDRVLQAAARNGLIPSVYLIGTPEQPYYSEANRDVSFPDTVAAYLRRHVCPKHLKQLMGGRYPNGPKEWVSAYRRLHGWEDDKPRGFAPRRVPASSDPCRSRTQRRDEGATSSGGYPAPPTQPPSAESVFREERGGDPPTQPPSAESVPREERGRSPAPLTQPPSAEPVLREERPRPAPRVECPRRVARRHTRSSALLMPWDDLRSLIMSIPRDTNRRSAMMGALPVPDKSLCVMDRSRQSLTLWALANMVDRLATSPREVVGALFRLEAHEVDIAIRYMSPINFARALNVPARELICFFHPVSDECTHDIDPLWRFIHWFHVKRSVAAESIQRWFRRQQLVITAETRRQPRKMYCQAKEICCSYEGGHCRLHERWQIALLREEQVRGQEIMEAIKAPPTQGPVPVRLLTCLHPGPSSAWATPAPVPEPAAPPQAEPTPRTTTQDEPRVVTEPAATTQAEPAAPPQAPPALSAQPAPEPAVPTVVAEPPAPLPPPPPSPQRPMVSTTTRAEVKDMLRRFQEGQRLGARLPVMSEDDVLAPVAEPAAATSPGSRESRADTLSIFVSHSLLPRASSHSSTPAHPAPVESTSELGDAATEGGSTGSVESPKTTHAEFFLAELIQAPPFADVNAALNWNLASLTPSLKASSSRKSKGGRTSPSRPPPPAAAPPEQASPTTVLDLWLHPRQRVGIAHETGLSRRLRISEERGVKQRGYRTKRLAEPPKGWHLAHGKIKGIGQSIDDHTPLQLTTEERRRTRQQQRGHASALAQAHARGEPGGRQILHRPASCTGCLFGSPSATVVMRYPRGDRRRQRPRPRATGRSRPSSRESSLRASTQPARRQFDLSEINSLLEEEKNRPELRPGCPLQSYCPSASRESAPPPSET